MDTLSDSIDWIKEKMGIIDRSYMRILRGKGRGHNSNIQDELALLPFPRKGGDIMRVLRNNGIGVHFGQAKIKGKIEYILLLRVSRSNYEMSHGPYVAYVIKRNKIIDNEGQLYSSFVYFMKRYSRLPNGWKDVRELIDDFYV